DWMTADICGQSDVCNILHSSASIQHGAVVRKNGKEIQVPPSTRIIRCSISNRLPGGAAAKKSRCKMRCKFQRRTGLDYPECCIPDSARRSCPRSCERCRTPCKVPPSPRRLAGEPQT